MENNTVDIYGEAVAYAEEQCIGIDYAKGYTGYENILTTIFDVTDKQFEKIKEYLKR